MTGPSESQIQRAFVEWLRWQAPKLGLSSWAWFSIPNAPRNKVTGARLKAEGMRAGMADMGFLLPDGRAAFIEFKTPTGRLSAEQRAFQSQCQLMGVPYAVCRSSDEAIAALSSWISEARTTE